MIRSTLSVLFTTLGLVHYSPAYACTTVTTGLNYVEYDPGAQRDTVIDFTILSTPLHNNRAQLRRDLQLIKPVRGTEIDGLEFDLEIIGIGSSQSAVSSYKTGIRDTPSALLGAGTYQISHAGNLSGVVALNARLTIPAGQSLTAGNYSLDFVIDERFLSQTGCTKTPTAFSNNEKFANFNVGVKPSFKISFDGATQQHDTLDFGSNLRIHEERSVDFVVNTNQAFEISVDSQNNGVLKLNNDPLSTHEIAYEMKINSQFVTEGLNYSDSRPGGTSGDEIFTFTAKILGDLGDNRAGNYRDIVTLTATPSP